MEQDAVDLMMLRISAVTIFDMLGKSSDSFSGYLEGFRTPEVGLKLDQFSMQRTSMEHWTNEDFSSRFEWTSYPNAYRMITLFGSRMFGKVVEYPGILDPGEVGYQPDRILQFEQMYLPEPPSSEVVRIRDMAMYGSGGIPWFVRQSMSDEETEGDANQYAGRIANRNGVRLFRAFKEQSVRLDKLAWCRAARSVQICWRASTAMDRTLGNWLLKIAVHAACTLERVRDGTLDMPLATVMLFQLCREIANFLQVIVALPVEVPDTQVPIQIAAVAAMLTEAGEGFISAGMCLLFTPQQGVAFESQEGEEVESPLDKEYEWLLSGLSEACKDQLYTASRLIIKTPQLKELARRCIKQTNFCLSRQLTVNMELHSTYMFHLIARSEHIATSRKLHSSCGDSCKKATCTDNDLLAGHLEENCGCSTTYFKPIETTELVLFDTENRELVLSKPSSCYVAISQVWFQGIFGQKSRRCGECSLRYLRTACNSIGVRYAWIDTLCMPTLENLRPKVIRQLRDIYLDARATLVVDAGLISTKARTVLDLSFAVSLSDWSSRIWTLQEGVLASKLLFCVGRHVLALPQVDAPRCLQDPRNLICGELLNPYGAGKAGLGLPFQHILELAAGRQTSYAQDFMYGLSALLPAVPTRVQDLESVAIEVAQMYEKVETHLGIDLGILQDASERCRTIGYRWMPQSAKTLSRSFETGINGTITAVGLVCPVMALIKLDSVSAVYEELMIGPLWQNIYSVELDMDIKYWYPTSRRGVFVGTCTEAKHLIFCLVGHANGERAYGFVVSPTSHRGVFQYIGGAAVVGNVQEKPDSILLT
ncbi:hypothetical protein BGZ76_007935 [Entomortierella beljakovae]|nr:hypothetical protein BGZ76_007935 [Entomortierella beljakovae]